MRHAESVRFNSRGQRPRITQPKLYATLKGSHYIKCYATPSGSELIIRLTGGRDAGMTQVAQTSVCDSFNVSVTMLEITD